MISSWIKREFRGLKDVIIVSFDEASHILDVFAIEQTYEATGRKTGGIAVAFTFYMRSREHPLLFHRPALGVHTGNTTDLERLCKGIVADIDTQILEPFRELFQGTQPPPTYKKE